jgi:hypothetical protein
VLPFGGLGDALDDNVAFADEVEHVAAQEEVFGERAEEWERCGDAEDVLHLGERGREGMEDVVRLHRFEDALDHGDLKAGGSVEGGGFAGEVVPDAEVFGAPCDVLVETDKAGGDAIGCESLLAGVDVGEEMDFDAAREVEAALDGGVDESCFFDVDQGVSTCIVSSIFEPVQIVSSTLVLVKVFLSVFDFWRRARRFTAKGKSEGKRQGAKDAKGRQGLGVWRSGG